MKITLPLLVFLLIFFNSLGQSVAQNEAYDAGYNNFVPPSPTAYELGKYGQIPVSLSTGTPNISVPLHTFSTSNLQLPVSLSYNSNGIKVDQVASWVGLGWSLNAGGVVTRIVRDRPDEDNSFPYPEKLSSNDIYSIKYMEKAMNEQTFDSEPDLFSFNFMGYTGKFLFDRNGQVRVMPHQNIRVERMRSTQEDRVVVTTPDGIKYYFGGTGATEYTKQMGYCTLNRDRAIQTAWYLTKIVHPKGDEIDLEYTSYTYSYIAGVNQTVTKNLQTLNECTECPVVNTLDSCSGMVVMEGVVLSRIKAKNFGEIQFQASDDRLDIIREKKLNALVILKPNGQPLRRFDFVHQYAQKRLFLKEVVEKDVANKQNQVYSFEYNQLDKMPAMLSFDQDHWGFYNGAANKYFVPTNTGVTDFYGRLLFTGVGGSGNREPNSAFSGIGLLQKITYPTGGHNAFTYEANTYYSWEMHCPDYREFELLTPASRTEEVVTQTQDVVIYSDEITLNYFVEENDDTVSHRELEFISVKVTDKLTGEVKYNEALSSGNEVSAVLKLISGNTYTISLISHGYEVYAGVNFGYCAAPPYQVYRNFETGGLRIKEVTATDPVVGNSQLTRYHYGKLDSLNASSGVIGYSPEYFSTYARPELCPVDNGASTSNGPSYISCYENACNYGVLHSNSQNALFNTSGQHITYQYVTVSYGQDFENGGEEHRFLVSEDVPGEAIYGNPIASAPYSNTAWENGLEDRVLIVKKGPDNTFITLQETTQEYAKDIRNEHRVKAIVAKKKMLTDCVTNATFTCDGTANSLYRWQCTADHEHTYAVSWFWEGWKCVSYYKSLTEIVPPHNVWTKYWTSPCEGKAAGETIIMGNVMDNWDVTEYENNTYWHYLASTITKQYDDNGQNPVVNTIKYYYDNPVHSQLTRTVATSSAGDTLTSWIAYPDDYDSIDFIPSLKEKHIVSVPIKTINTVNDNQVAGQVLAYNAVGQVTQAYAYESSTLKQATPHSPALLIPSTDYKHKASLGYSSKNRIQESIGADGIRHSYIWGYDDTQLMAHVQDAAPNQVAYTGFELSGTGNWIIEKNKTLQLTSQSRQVSFQTYRTQQVDFTNSMSLGTEGSLELIFTSEAGEEVRTTVTDANSHGTVQLVPGSWTAHIVGKIVTMGSIALDVRLIEETDLPKSSEYKLGAQSLNMALIDHIAKKGLTAGSYQLLYWKKNGAVIAKLNGQLLPETVLKTDADGWELARITLPVAQATDELLLNGTGLLDELKLFPVDAFMTTYTYEPGLGLTSKTDPNQVTEYYEYDSFGRMKGIKDDQRNVLKSYQYHYQTRQQ
ncbi:hypothetical protein [Pontibacter fetidus]|uniref:YD repeat-containing protein n=1 Tax=Pontibacter fetidus TaxID=2700082 RepID=A0A6B2H5E9_9BACT|nr:hypothetical protein [Pontibacter fetidus]NDK57358.1 hypothetical protein [Pontibacter fetidus]